jgi:hypothetical protein
MGSRRRYKKRKAAARASASSQTGDDSVPVLKRKKKYPSASDSDSDSNEAKILKLEEACPSEEGKILKLKKEFVAANQGSVARIPFVTAAEEEALLQPTRVMESFKARLFTIIPDECILTEDELAKHSQDFQESYAGNMDLMNKMRAWQKALLEQYDKFGYAVDESEAEVTDDEDDHNDNTVVK